MASIEPLLERVGPPVRLTTALCPSTGDGEQLRPERIPKFGDEGWQRSVEVPVLASAEPVPGHVDRRPEPIGCVVQPDQRVALLPSQNPACRGDADVIEVRADHRPVDSAQPFLSGVQVTLTVDRTAHAADSKLQQEALGVGAAEIPAERAVGAQRRGDRAPRPAAGSSHTRCPRRGPLSGCRRAWRPPRSWPCGRSRCRTDGRARCGGTRSTVAGRAERGTCAAGRRSTGRALGRPDRGDRGRRGHAG